MSEKLSIVSRLSIVSQGDEQVSAGLPKADSTTTELKEKSEPPLTMFSNRR